MNIDVAAFWTPDQQDWINGSLTDPVVSFLVLDGSWPATAAGNSGFHTLAASRMQGRKALILGYVFTRTGTSNNASLREPSLLRADVDAWYTQFGRLIDGINFDNAVLPQDAGDSLTYPLANGPATAKAYWSSFVQWFRHAHPTARPGNGSSRAMLLAGSTPNEWVVQLADLALLFEQTSRPDYLFLNAAYLANGNLQYPPRWWQDPAYRGCIVHTVNRCPSSDRQGVLETARGRNAGHIFVCDNYASLPSYFADEVREAGGYQVREEGLDDEELMRGAHRVGVQRLFLTAWPNFEQAHYSYGHMRGTMFLRAIPGVKCQDVPLSELQPLGWPDASGSSRPADLHDVAGFWYAAHQWAVAHGYETGIPTFEIGHGTVAGVTLFAQGLPWLKKVSVPKVEVYEHWQGPNGKVFAPPFTSAGAVVRNVHRWAQAQGPQHVGAPVVTGFPTFAPDQVDSNHRPLDPSGWVAQVDSYLVLSTASTPVEWHDVNSNEYANSL